MSDKSPDRPQRQEGQERQPADQQHDPELAHGGLPQRKGAAVRVPPIWRCPGICPTVTARKPLSEGWVPGAVRLPLLVESARSDPERSFAGRFA